MERHALTKPAIGVGPATIASVLCGAHAQVLGAAELSIGRRLAGATRADVRHALWTDRTLIKTFGPRGTVHLLATHDLPTWTGALSALPSSVPRDPDPVLFSSAQADEVIAAIGDALADAERTVDELTEEIRKRTGPWAVERTMDAFQTKWPRWRQLTSTAAHRGVLCFGPDRGRNVTYTNPHRWLPGFQPEKGDEALRTLVTRYLYAYGPATPNHFARWLAIPLRRSVELFDGMAADLESVEVDGERMWVLAADTATSAPQTGLRLLPYFDAYVVAGQPRDRLYPGSAATRALTPTGQAGNYPVVLIDGVVGGVWHQRRAGRKVTTITVEPLQALTRTQRRELDDEVDLVAAVMETEATLRVGKVTVGPHA